MKGDFHRSDDTGTHVSHINAVVPFDIWDSSNFHIRGFDVKGNVDQMTRDAGVVEGANHGLQTSNCRDYSITDMDFEGFSADGIMLGTGNDGDGAPYAADQNAYLQNIDSSNNARNNLSVIQLAGGVFLDSSFVEAGHTEGSGSGSYGYHSPAAGVDVEPNYVGGSIDVETGELLFDNVVIENSVGSQFASAMGDKVHGITISNSGIDASSSTWAYAVILTVEHGLIEHSTIDTGFSAGGVYAAWSGITSGDTTIRDTQIATEGYGLVATNNNVNVVVEGCTFQGRASQAHIPYVTSTNASFVDNTIFVPKEAYYNPSGTYCVASLLQNVELSSGNTFTTDLVPGESIVNGETVPATAYFAASYNFALVAVDWFEQGFHPAYNITTWDPEDPYSQSP